MARALFFGALAELLFGYDLGIGGIALLSINKSFTLSPGLSGFVISSLLLGAAIGVAVAGRLADRYGRKPILMVISIFFILGGLATALAPDVWLLIVGRFLMGIGVGGSASVVTVYLVEVAPTKHRGKAGSLGQVMVVSGIFIAYVVGYLLQPLDAWRWMLGLSIIPGVILAIGLGTMPESPRWLVTRGRIDEARHSLERLQIPDADRELAHLREAHEASSGTARSTGAVIKEMFARGARRNSIAACVLAILVQFVGTNSIIYYAPSALIAGGFSETAAVTANLGVGVINIVFTLVGLALVDRFPRRTVLTIGITGMFLAMVFLTAVSLSDAAHTSAGAYLTLAGMLLFLASFAASWGLLVRVVVSELFPSSIRGTATGLILVLNWVANFIVGQSFPSLLAISSALSFGIFAGVAVIAFIFVRKMLPETGGGSSLEQITPANQVQPAPESR